MPCREYRPHFVRGEVRPGGSNNPYVRSLLKTNQSLSSQEARCCWLSLCVYVACGIRALWIYLVNIKCKERANNGVLSLEPQGYQLNPFVY
jgi:hypothetical protein